jgi:hypothetical protein
VHVTIAHADEVYIKALSPYIEQSEDGQRMVFDDGGDDTMGFNIVIGSKCDAALLNHRTRGSKVVSNDYRGLEDLSRLGGFESALAGKKDFLGKFYVM